MARTQLRHIYTLELLQILFGQINRINIHSRTLKPLILPQTIVMISLRLRSKHDNLELLDALTDRVDCIVLLPQPSSIILIELHIDIIEVVSLLL